jgi:hypothetical protein
MHNEGVFLFLRRNLYIPLLIQACMQIMKGGVVMNKRGLSDIVTTVLIILLVVAAVVVIWGFIRPTLDQAGKSIQKGATCINNYIEPVTCKVTENKNTAGTIANYNVTIGYKRTTDDSIVANVDAVTANYEYGDGSLQSIGNYPTVTVAGASASNTTGLLSKKPTKVAVSTDFTLKDGSKLSCPSAVATCS